MMPCRICGGALVSIRGRAPGAARRVVCPTCLAERMDLVREFFWGREYGSRLEVKRQANLARRAKPISLGIDEGGDSPAAQVAFLTIQAIERRERREAELERAWQALGRG